MATEANPTDVSKASGVKQANTHFVLFCYFFSVILFLLEETFYAFRLWEYRYKTFLTLSEEEKAQNKSSGLWSVHMCLLRGRKS